MTAGMTPMNTMRNQPTTYQSGRGVASSQETFAPIDAPVGSASS